MAALGGSVSRRYARALFALGVDRGRFELFGDELGSLAKLFASSTELRSTLENPVFKPSDKRRVLATVLARLSLSDEVRRFILLLFERGRLPLLSRIVRDYGLLCDDKLGQVRGTLTSAAELPPESLARVTRALERRLGKKVILENRVDPELLGGVVAHVGDLVLDGSLRTRLAALSGRLANTDLN